MIIFKENVFLEKVEIKKLSDISFDELLRIINQLLSTERRAPMASRIENKYGFHPFNKQR